METIDINKKVAIGRKTVDLIRFLRGEANGNSQKLSIMIKSATKIICSEHAEGRYRMDWINDALGKA